MYLIISILSNYSH